MRPRIAVAALAVVALAAAPSAFAKTAAKPKPKPKTYCNLLTAPSGNGTWQLAPVVTSSSLDVQGGDVATGAKTMVAVLRLGSNNFAADPYSHLGYSWSFSTESTLGQKYVFTASLGLDGTTWRYAATVDGAAAPSLKFAVMPDGHSLQWTISRKDSPALNLRPNNVFHTFTGQSEVESSSADSAINTTNKYPDKAPSCVHAS